MVWREGEKVCYGEEREDVMWEIERGYDVEKREREKRGYNMKKREKVCCGEERGGSWIAERR